MLLTNIYIYIPVSHSLGILLFTFRPPNLRSDRHQFPRSLDCSFGFRLLGQSTTIIITLGSRHSICQRDDSRFTALECIKRGPPTKKTPQSPKHPSPPARYSRSTRRSNRRCNRIPGPITDWQHGTCHHHSPSLRPLDSRRNVFELSSHRNGNSPIPQSSCMASIGFLGNFRSPLTRARCCELAS